jgi:beta-aspartyl-peptidase (threonine type)
MLLADRRSLRLVGLIAVLVAARARSSPDQDPTPDPSPARDAEVRRAVRSLLDEQVACWNRGDMDAFAATYWKSPELVFQSGGDRNLGWDAMRERYRRRYQSEGRAMGRLTFDRLEVRPLADDLAYAFGAWALAMPDGSNPSGLFTVILRKRPEGWRIVHDHTSAAAP